MAGENKKNQVQEAPGATVENVVSAEVQKTIDNLKTENESLKAKNAELENSYIDLKSLNNAHIEEIQAKKAKISNLDKVISDYHSENNQLKEELTNLSTELGTAQEAAEKGYLTVKSKKKSYRITGKKFYYNGKEHSAEDLIKNQGLVDELVELGVGFLTEVKEVN